MKKKEQNNKKVLNNKTIAILYLLCGVIWIVSGIFEVVAKTSGVLSFIVGGVLMILSIFYFYKVKKEK